MKDERLTKLQKFYEDPSLAGVLSESQNSSMFPTSITDVINCICKVTFVDNLVISQFKSGPKTHTFFK
jgi:hypothetical protein